MAEKPEERAFPPHPPGYRVRRGRNWFFLGLLYAGYYLCRYNMSIVAPEMRDELGLSKAEYGKIDSARSGGYAVGQFINGLFSDGLGGRLSMAIGALGTICLNVAFGLVSSVNIAWILTALICIRLVDGYAQAFGAPGMVKINTSWFQRRERGRFAGIFGLMIQLGLFGVNYLGPIIVAGFSFSVLVFTVDTREWGWRAMFYIPPMILSVLLVLMWFNVKNHPEEAGFTIPHDDDEHGDNHEERLPLGYVFRKIASNSLAWINAGAYFCTGFVRTAIFSWWVLYLDEVWGSGKESELYDWLKFLLPASAVAGSMLSGLLSDTLFRGRRSPVAAMLYAGQTVVAVAAVVVFDQGSSLGTPVLAAIFLTALSFACNASHSIIGTAAAMDIGGRKMAGFAAGVIDSFQYFGAIFGGFALGWAMDKHGWPAYWLSMIPFGLLGTILMGYVMITTRGKDVKGG